VHHVVLPFRHGAPGALREIVRCVSPPPGRHPAHVAG
jgi:hypothetical protein